MDERTTGETLLEMHHDRPASDNGDYVGWGLPALDRLISSPDFHLRFWSKVDKSADGCWLWTSNQTGQLNHGQVHIGRFGRKLYNEYAHRVSWTLARGPIPDGMQVNHKCDVPQCVNPDHLYLGTQADNMRDASQRGRFPLTRRPRKLTDRCVLAIRVLAEGGVQQRLIARAFDVTAATISLIVSGVRRTHVR